MAPESFDRVADAAGVLTSRVAKVAALFDGVAPPRPSSKGRRKPAPDAPFLPRNQRRKAGAVPRWQVKGR